MWRGPCFFAVAAALVLYGCRVANHEEHVLRPADHAQLLHSPRTPACLAVHKEDVHLVAHAVDSGDESQVKQLVQEGRAFEAPPEAAVLIEHEAFSERGVVIADGQAKGQRGWVPYEWLSRVETARSK